MVFYLGGVTMAEVAALRFLSQREESQESPSSLFYCDQYFWPGPFQVEYIVATTSVITGNFLLQTLNDPLFVEPDYYYDQDSLQIDSMASIDIRGVTD